MINQSIYGRPLYYDSVKLVGYVLSHIQNYNQHLQLITNMLIMEFIRVYFILKIVFRFLSNIRYILDFDTFFKNIHQYWLPFCFGHVIISSGWCDGCIHILGGLSGYRIKHWKEAFLCNAFSHWWLNPYSECLTLIFIDSYWKWITWLMDKQK